MTTIARATMTISKALDMITMDFVTNITRFEIMKRTTLVGTGNRTPTKWDVRLEMAEGKGPVILFTVDDEVFNRNYEAETWDEADTRAVQWCLRLFNNAKVRWKESLSQQDLTSQ